MELGDALAYLDSHLNVEALVARGANLRLDGMRRLMDVMAEPQRQYPVIHVTGTNGKTSTVRMIADLVRAKGLSVGTYTSPHLSRVNERIAWNGEPIADVALAALLGDLSEIEPLSGHTPTWFEVMTAAAFRWFADIAVDAAIIEVGLGGRYDTTNVADGVIAVVTNVEVDHVEYIGPTRRDIAIEKAGIVKPGSTLVLGEDDVELLAIFRDAGAEQLWLRNKQWGCFRNRVAHGGRVISLRTPGAEYRDLFLSLHGSHQGDNAAQAVAAAEAFFGAPLDEEIVAESFASARAPGRMEVVSRQPLCILDGAHNPAGARAAADTVVEEFGETSSCILVVGLLKGRDASEMLRAFSALTITRVIACPPPSPRAMDPEEVARAAADLGIPSTTEETVDDAIDLALADAGEDTLVLVTGSLYLVGAARSHLLG